MLMYLSSKCIQTQYIAYYFLFLKSKRLLMCQMKCMIYLQITDLNLSTVNGFI